MGKKLLVEFPWVRLLQFSWGIIFLNSNGAALGKESSEAKCDAEHTTNMAQSVTTGLRSFQHLGKGWGQSKNEPASKGPEGEISAKGKMWLPEKEVLWVIAGKLLKPWAMICRCSVKRRRLQAWSDPINSRREGMGIGSELHSAKPKWNLSIHDWPTGRSNRAIHNTGFESDWQERENVLF